MAHGWLTSISSNRSKSMIAGCCDRFPRRPTDNATGALCRMATISSSFAKKGNVAAYPRERQSLRRSKFRGESTPNLKRSPSVSSCLDLAPEDLPKPVLIDGLIDRYL